jgi:hypothetical protein
MKQQLTVLAAGALAILALAAYPTVASAGEFTADCSSGATCSGTIAGSAAAISNSAGETISCTSISGSASLTSGTSTITVSLVAHGCRETITFFKFSCNTVGQPSGTISTGPLVGHSVYVESDRSITGIVITNVNVTFTCAGFADKTITGNILAGTPNPQCGVFKSSVSGTLETTAHGTQQYKQVTTTGTVFDLISNNDSGGSYLTSALKGSLSVTFVEGKQVKATC